MKFKRLIILLVILAAAGAAYLISEKAAERQEEQTDQANRVVELKDSLNVTLVKLSGRLYPKPVTIVRRPEKAFWEITQPVVWPADGLAMSRLVGGVLDARIVKRIKEPGDLKQFGLAEPAVHVELTDSSGAKAVVDYGGFNPSKTLVYAKVPGSKEVWLLDVKDRGPVNRTLLELRDKDAIEFVVANVKSFHLDWGKEQFTLIKKRGGADPLWVFADGKQADPEAVEDLLYGVHGMRAQSFLDEGINPERMGLAKPVGSISLEMADGAKTGFKVGGPVPGKQERYARRLEGGPVMALSTAMLENLDKAKRFTLLQRRVLKFKRTSAVGLTVKLPETEQAFAKQEGQWKRTKPPSDQIKDGAPGELFVWDLWDLKWRKKLSKADFSKPAAEITLAWEPVDKSQDTEKTVDIKLTVGNLDPESGLVPVKVAGESGVFGVNKDFLDIIPGRKNTGPAGAVSDQANQAPAEPGAAKKD